MTIVYEISVNLLLSHVQIFFRVSLIFGEHFEMNIYFIKKNAKISNVFLKRIF
jgi:hypothetical protein